MRFISVLVALMVLSLGYAAEAPDEQLVNVKSEVLSKNVFRGEVLSNDYVAATTLGLNKGLFGLDIKMVNDLTADNDNGGDVTELDLDLHISDTLIKNDAAKYVNELTLFGGVELFTYPELDKHATAEVYLGIDTVSNKLKGIHTKYVAHYDFDEADGFYLESVMYRPIAVPFGFKVKSQEFKTTATPEFGMGYGSANYNKFHWESEGSDTTDWNAALKLICESKNVMFGPSVMYTDLVGTDMQDKGHENSSNWVYGFMVGGKF